MVLSVFLYAVIPLSAQDEYSSSLTGGNFDPGDLLVEVTGTPFQGSSLMDFGSLRLRYGVTQTLVPRLGISMDLNNTQTTPDVVTNLSKFELRPGLEYHLGINDAFRSYAFVDVILGSRSASRESTTGSSVDGSTQVPTSANYNFSSAYRGYFRYGAALGFGADYHFSSRFYIGAEIGFQLYQDKMSEISVDKEKFQDSVTSSYGNMSTQNSIRIGFKLF